MMMISNYQMVRGRRSNSNSNNNQWMMNVVFYMTVLCCLMVTMILNHDGQQQQQKENSTPMTLIASQSQSQLHQSSLLFLGTATASSAAVATTTSTPNSLSLMRSPLSPTTAVTSSPSPSLSSSVTTMMAMTTCTSTVASASASSDNDSSSRSMPIIEGETDNNTRLPLQKVSAVPVRIATVLQKNPMVYRAAATILIGTVVVPLMGVAASVGMFGVHHVLPAAVLSIVGRVRLLLVVTVTGGGTRTTRLLSLARHSKRWMSKIHLQKITKLIYRIYNNSYCWYDDHIIPSPKQQQR
mmetsp:Transcript_28378/g.30544  ORF Transcript_28378/g.30544 Transcript_28378/m.30544 type:complete len:297 (-) Transcript_28378:102-992(-)